MFCSIRNVWDIQEIGFKLKIIELELMKSASFFSSCDDKIYIQNNGCKGLALRY